LKDLLVDIKGISHSFSNEDKLTLQNINLKVYTGDVIVLLGDNGSGKTTLLKCLAGSIYPKSGEISYQDKPLKDWHQKDLAKQLALVSTQINYSPLLKVWEFIAFGRYPFTNWLGTLNQEDKNIIDTAMELSFIKHLSNKGMAEISDGERQKVTICRAIVQETKLLVLDEPTTHLDIKNSRAIFKLIQEQNTQQKKTIIFSSHQVEQALDIANKIWLFNNNEVIECSPEELDNSQEYKNILYG